VLALTAFGAVALVIDHQWFPQSSVAFYSVIGAAVLWGLFDGWRNDP
jgi:hypothetical protein